MTLLGVAGRPAPPEGARLPVVALVADVAAGKRALVRAMTDLDAICAEANTLVDRLTNGLQLLAAEPEGPRYWDWRERWVKMRSRLKYLAFDETDKWTGELVYAGAWRRGLAVLTAYLALPEDARRAAEGRYGPFLDGRGHYAFFVARWPKARIAGLDGMTPSYLDARPRREWPAAEISAVSKARKTRKRCPTH